MLSILFPPKLGRCDISGMVLLQRIADGEVPTIEVVPEAGVVRAFSWEYVEGRWVPTRIR